MQTHNLGYPRIGNQRELKKACEKYWEGNINLDELLQTGKQIRQENRELQRKVDISLIPTNDFSYYDHVLDTSLMVGNIPSRFIPLIQEQKKSSPVLYFAMARGLQKGSKDITALEMTKWFNTKYHYLVPEFCKNQKFSFVCTDVINEFLETKQSNINVKPIILGSVSYLLLGKEKERGFHRIDLLNRLLPVYKEILNRLNQVGATYIQLDEPCLVLDLDEPTKQSFRGTYHYLSRECTGIQIFLATYFGNLAENLPLVCSLPIYTLHIDLVKAPEQLEDVLDQLPKPMSLSLGIVDGRNIWKNDYEKSLTLINKATLALGQERIWIAPSCSLLHSPCDLELETNETILPEKIKQRISFSKQKFNEVSDLAKLSDPIFDEKENLLVENKKSILSRTTSSLIHDCSVQARISSVTPKDFEREQPFSQRKSLQSAILNLPIFPTTTIGSFTQTKEIREVHSKFKKGVITEKEYISELENFTKQAIETQEQIKLDLLVHGEFERNDMVEYLGEQLNGFRLYF